MKFECKEPITIYRKDFDNRPSYSYMVSRKNEDGTYQNEFKRIQFRSGTDIPNKTKIYIKNAFESFYKDKEGKAVFYPVVLEYSTVEETIEKAKEEVDPFKDFGETIQITSEQLPF